GQAVDGEVLSELSKGEVSAMELLLPVVVGIELVDKHCSLLTSMTSHIPLRVAVDVQHPHHALALNRSLPNGGSDRLAAPINFAWQSNIKGEKPGQHVCFLGGSR